MIPRPCASRACESRLAALLNWLALLALVALGVCAVPARAAAPEAGFGALMWEGAADARPLAAPRVATRGQATRWITAGETRVWTAARSESRWTAQRRG